MNVLHQGVWLPPGETHLVEHMDRNARFVSGRGTYQYKKLEKALALTKRRGLALDIGAHVGLWSMHLADHFANVVAFEPVPLHRTLFAKNVRQPNVTLEACALGEREDSITMEVNPATSGNAHVACVGRHPGTKGVADPDRVESYADVAMRRLDSFGLFPDFIKIDVEGLERAVIAGGEHTIRSCRPVMVVEQKGNASAYGEAPMAAIDLLRSWGAREAAVLSGDYLMVWE